MLTPAMPRAVQLRVAALRKRERKAAKRLVEFWRDAAYLLRMARYSPS